MRRKNRRLLVCAVSAVCLTLGSGMTGMAADTGSNVPEIKYKNHAKVDLSWAALINEIPKVAEVAVDTQEWHGKAVSNIDGETDVLSCPEAGSEAVGRMYASTIVTVEEKGDTWSKISSGEVIGYIENEKLAFGQEAVTRADTVCPEVTVVEDGQEVVARNAQAAKTIAQIEQEEAERKAKEEAEQKAKEEAERKAEEEKAEAQAAAQNEKEVKAASAPAVSVSSDDRTLLAAIIHCEAGGEPYEGQVAVGAVIMNRVRSGSFPNTIRDVIYQKGQFGPAITGKLDRVLASGAIYESCYRAADAALAGENPIGGALYFGNGNSGQQIGNHYFH